MSEREVEKPAPQPKVQMLPDFAVLFWRVSQQFRDQMSSVIQLFGNNRLGFDAATTARVPVRYFLLDPVKISRANGIEKQKRGSAEKADSR
jgi:hypothetical protein